MIFSHMRQIYSQLGVSHMKNITWCVITSARIYALSGKTPFHGIWGWSYSPSMYSEKFAPIVTTDVTPQGLLTLLITRYITIQGQMVGITAVEQSIFHGKRWSNRNIDITTEYFRNCKCSVEYLSNNFYMFNMIFYEINKVV